MSTQSKHLCLRLPWISKRSTLLRLLPLKLFCAQLVPITIRTLFPSTPSRDSFSFFFSLYCPFPFPFSGTCLATRKNFPATVFFSLITSPLCHPAAADDDITKGGPPFLDKQVLQHALFASLAALCVRLCSGGLAHGRKQPLLVDFRHSVVISAHRTDALNIQLFVLCLAAQALFSFGVGVLFDFVSSCSFWFWGRKFFDISFYVYTTFLSFPYIKEYSFPEFPF